MSGGFKSGFVALVGRPNVGKSTLINALTGEKVAIVSEKPQTTRHTIRGIVNGEDYQIILVDTPGMHKPRHRLGEFMVRSIQKTLSDVDAVLHIVEATESVPGGGDRYIAEQLTSCGKAVVLLINKVDLVKKEELFPIIDNYIKLCDYNAVIPISASIGDGIGRVIAELKKVLPEGERLFTGEEYTDQTERQIAAEYIREQALKLLSDEVPHGIGVEIAEMKEISDKNMVSVIANIYCEKDSHKGIIIGRNGEMLKKIGQLARSNIEDLLGVKVFLQLWVKVKKDWRNDAKVLNTLGYRDIK